jgi:asparagine synthase (glutamine-hydrolysing)
MSQFIAAVDPSAERRKRFIERAEHDLEASYGSPARTFEHGELAVVTWTQSWEPFRRSESALGTQFIWGRAMEPRQHISSAPDLGALWRELPRIVPRPLEGIHQALLLLPDGSWVVGADIFGFAPLYYSLEGDCTIIGSTQDLFRAHPAFRAELDPEGLAGILLTNGLVEGRCLLKRVRRLDAGNLLFGGAGKAPRELIQYRPELSDRYFGASYEENFARVRDTLDQCLDRHLDSSVNHGLILSGGLDSRLMAGLLKERNADVTAFSFGSPLDIESQCALRVSRAFGLRHRIVPVQMEKYVEHAEHECRWKHLANGFGNTLFHERLAEAADIRGGMFSGFAMEELIAGGLHGWAGADPEQMSFDTFFKKFNKWGARPETVKRLLARNFDTTIVDDLCQQMRRAYDGQAERAFQKPWLFGLRHFTRFHTSAALGLHGRWPWPIVPYLDTQMIDLVGGMPYEHIKKRRMQYQLLEERFPSAAEIPLDCNSFRVQTIKKRNGRLVNYLANRPRELLYRWTRRFRDRRFYYWAMDFNSPGWSSIREAVEPLRKRATSVLDESTLTELLPSPGKRLEVPDQIIDASKSRLMAGFLLWSARYS